MSPTNVAAAGACRAGSTLQPAYCSWVLAASSAETAMMRASCPRESVRRNATSSTARSSRTGVPAGSPPPAGASIVFELCIRMIIGYRRLPVRSAHPQVDAAHGDHVAAHELPAAARLRCPVDPHL